MFASKCGQTGAKSPVSKYHHQRTNSFQPRVEMSAFKYTLHCKWTPRKGGTNTWFLRRTIERFALPQARHPPPLANPIDPAVRRVRAWRGIPHPSRIRSTPRGGVCPRGAASPTPRESGRPRGAACARLARHPPPLANPIDPAVRRVRAWRGILHPSRIRSTPR